MASEPWVISKDVFYFIWQTFGKCFSDDHVREAIFNIIWTAIVRRIKAAQKQNSKIIVKPYTIHSDNDSNVAYLHEVAVNIDVELVDECLLTETSEEEFELTTSQPGNLQGNLYLFSTL